MELIILCGPKHSGKTSAGRELAKKLSAPFFDLDQLVEEKTGQSVRELFLADEALFQREEAVALAELFASDLLMAIVAPGGGIIDNPGAMALIQKESARHCTAYLEVSSETAWRRIASDGELPPFLKAPTLDAAKEKHRLLHERRAKEYKKIADYCISAEAKSAVCLAEELYNLLQYKRKDT